MKYLIIIFIALSFLQNAQAQLSLAEAYYSVNEYNNAIPYFKKHMNRNPKDDSTCIKLGLCYLATQRDKDALKIFNYLYDRNVRNAQVTNHLAALLMKAGNHTKAKEIFEFIGNLKGQIACDSAINWLRNLKNVEIINQKRTNSKYSETSLTNYKNGIVFSSNREQTIIKDKIGKTGEPSFNLMYASLDADSSLKSAKIFSMLSLTKYEDGKACFSEDDKNVFYSKVTLDKDKVYRYKMFASKKKGLGWGESKYLIFNDSLANFYDPAIDSENKLFFFASDMNGGYGGTDIYACIKVDSLWSNPINLGPLINTAKNELAPFYDLYGNLYFASNGHLSMGGYDLFKATQEDGDWVNVENLKAPINSSADEISITFLNPKTGFISSNREGGLGKFDIYKFVFKP